MNTDFDVVVVGFGPSGAVAASLLGQAGVKTLVIDRMREVYEKPRAIAIDHEILRLFQNFGVAEKVLAYVAPFTASEHFGAQGQLIRRIDMVEPPYPLGYTPSMVFTQPPVEAILRSQAESFPSVEVVLGISFKSLKQAGGRVNLSLQDEAGNKRDVTTTYVIGCDGASSEIRRAVGVELKDLIFDEPWMVIDILANESGLAKLSATSAQYCEPARPSTYIVGPNNHRRWEIMLQEDEDPQFMQQETQVWKLLARWLTPEDGKLWRASCYRFHALVASDWRVGNVFLAGDAAHQQPPFIGQGMCQGIRDVGNLVWKLVAVITGRAGEALLDSYAVERGQHVRTLTSRIKAIGHMICERDPAAAAARDAKLLADNGGTPPSTTRQDIVPPLEAGLLAAQAHRANGTLFPQPWVADQRGGRHHMDDVAGTGWRLVLDGRDQDLATYATAAGPAIIRVQPGTAGEAPDVAENGINVIEQDGVVARWFDRYECVAALVRPDHYVYGVATSVSDITALLAGWRDGPAAPHQDKGNDL